MSKENKENIEPEEHSSIKSTGLLDVDMHKKNRDIADKLRTGDRFTISGVGINKKKDIIKRTRNDNKKPPFWGVNLRTRKRGVAIRLAIFTKQKDTDNTIHLSICE